MSAAGLSARDSGGNPDSCQAVSGPPVTSEKGLETPTVPGAGCPGEPEPGQRKPQGELKSLAKPSRQALKGVRGWSEIRSRGMGNCRKLSH